MFLVCRVVKLNKVLCLYLSNKTVKGKHKKIFFLTVVFVFLFGFYSFTHAQNPIDKCTNYLSARNYKKAIKSGKQAVSLYPKSVHANFCLGIAYNRTGQFNLALGSLKKAEIYATDKRDLAAIYSALGLTYEKKGDLENALLDYSRSLQLARELGDRDTESAQLNNVALILRRKDELNKALSYYRKSLKLTINERIKAATYNDIGLIYYDKGEYNKAINYYKKAIEIDTRYSNYNGSGQAMLNLGNTYTEMNNFNDSYIYLQKGLKMIQKVGDKYWEATAYRDLGLYFIDKGNKKLAKKYFNRAYGIFSAIGAKTEAQGVLFEIKRL